MRASAHIQPTRSLELARHDVTVAERHAARRPAPLLERAGELAVLDDALGAAAAGAGAGVLVEGPPGIGKTELLRATVARARAQGVLVLTAHGAALEQSAPFAVVRQLFEPVLSESGGAARDRLLCGAAGHARAVVDPHAAPGPAAVDASAVLHGLYWLTVNLTADRPVLLVVDDLHWCDEASLSWLGYLARRIDGLPVALVASARAAEPGADDALLERLRASAGLRRVEPAALSIAAVGELARAQLGEQVDASFGSACHAATRGNPFYVTELLRELRQDGVTGTADNVHVIGGLTPRAVVEATLARLGRMPGEARAVAEAVAVLEPGAELRHVAELTGLDLDVLVDVADALVELGMLRSVAPCRFEHPILRSAVRSEIAPARRGLLHLKAARAFAGAGMALEAVAAHLVQAPPSGEPWVVSTLRRAAAQASDRGAPGGAVSYLERALAERPAPSERRELLLALGRAESDLRRPRASEHLREALALAERPGEVAAAALALSEVLFNEGAIDEAYAIALEAVRRTDGHDSRPGLELRAFLLLLAGPAGSLAETADHADELAALAPGTSPAAGAVQASLAIRELVTGGPRERVLEHAEHAMAGLAGGSGAGPLGWEAPGMAFIWTDALDRAEALFGAAIEDASRTGRVRAFENFSALRGFTLQRRGDLADAAADVEPVLAAAAEDEAAGAGLLFALVTRVLLLVDGGRPDAAEALASMAPVPAAFERLPIVALLRHAQGVTQLAQHKLAEAATTLTRVGEVADAAGWRAPSMLPWRSGLALALAGTDRHGEGIELARAELRLAERSGSDRARGVALRALGLLEGGDAGLRRLADAERALARSPARLEHGWACYELGAGLRHADRLRDARAPLDRALDIALACGAERLGDHAREELKALGARPRTTMLTGAESLTSSERRVCRLAAGGRTNGEIAQALFVTPKTVETHLRNAYRKLAIASRTELPQALGTTPA